MAKWTSEKVRRFLPNIFVRIGMQRAIARLSGRANTFATVSVTNTGTLHSNSKIFGDWQASWKTIADCLNRGAALIVE